MQLYYLVMDCIYFGLIVLWYWAVWIKYANHGGDTGNLQKSLIALPLLKFTNVGMYSVYAQSCPWGNQVSARYIMMALVTIATI